jgi:hypothetical protein
MQKYSIILMIALCSMFASVSHAMDNGNGVDVTSLGQANAFVNTATWFLDFDPSVTANFIYNEAGGTDVDSGLYVSAFKYDKGNITVKVSTLNSTSIEVRIEGKNAFGYWVEIISKTYTAAQTIGESFPIVTYYNSIRVCLKVTGDAAGDVVDVTSDFLTIKRY